MKDKSNHLFNNCRNYIKVTLCQMIAPQILVKANTKS